MRGNKGKSLGFFSSSRFMWLPSKHGRRSKTTRGSGVSQPCYFLHRVSAASRSLKIYCTVLQHATNCHSTSLSLCLYLPLFVLNATSTPTSSPSFFPLILFRRGAHSIILSARISVCPSFPPLLSAAERERRGMGRAGERKERWTD